MRVAFVYPNPRGDLPLRVAAGEAPDTSLLGQNHMADLGIDAFVHDSALRRTHTRGGAAHRVTWLLREVAAPWEVGDADVIVTPLPTLLPVMARLRPKTRVLLVSYGIVAQWQRAGGGRRQLIRASVRAADRVVTIASSTRTQLARIGRMDESRVTFVPFGVDDAFWQPTPPARDGHVLAVGRDLARDYSTFAAALAGTGLRGVIVAKEENLRGVELPPNVEVKMFISTDELKQLYADAACVVAPLVPDSDPRGTESSGNTAVLEAMACGHAPVVTDRVALHDYLDSDSSTVVPPADPPALRRAIEEAVSDHARATEKGQAARSRIENGLTTRAFAQRLARVLEEIA